MLNFSVSPEALVAIVTIATPFIIYFLRNYGGVDKHEVAISKCSSEHDQLIRDSVSHAKGKLEKQVSAMTIEVTKLIENQRNMDEKGERQYGEAQEDFKTLATSIDKLGSNVFSEIKKTNSNMLKLAQVK